MIDRLRRLWNRPITDRDRPRLLVASVAVIVASAALALIATRGGGDEPARSQPRPAAPAPEPVADAQADDLPPSSSGAQPDPSLRPADVEAAERAARRFLAGYLRYSYGRGRAAELEGVSDELRAELGRAPPRVPARVRGARPRVLSVTSELHGDGLESVALVDDGQRSYSMSLFLERDRGRGWQVAAVGG